MTPLQKIRTSFSTQLTLWVAGFVTVTLGVVIFLLARFSEDVIRDETIDTTQQALENTALRIDNTLRQAEITARLEKKQLQTNRSRIEQMIDENGLQASLRESLPHLQLYVTRSDSSQLAYNDQENYVFSQPVGNSPYSLTAVCPVDDIKSRYSRMHDVMILWGIIGMVSLLFILYYIIGHHLRPLHRLADSAESIADGDLDTPIADTRQEDETGRLQNSLSLMQRKLAAYMDEMQQKQEMLSRQNAELQAAYGEAKAYEEMKAKFMHDMTGRIALPVDQVCRNTDAICLGYAQLTKAEMIRCQTEIVEGTEAITQLLDQLTKETTPPQSATLSKDIAGL